LKTYNLYYRILLKIIPAKFYNLKDYKNVPYEKIIVDYLH